MPEIARFFGIIIRMFYDEHEPAHLHTEYSGAKATFDFNGNVLNGDLKSRTATKLVREWIDIHILELNNNWILAKDGREIHKIDPLN